jgi:hypothetical protein
MINYKKTLDHIFNKYEYFLISVIYPIVWLVLKKLFQIRYKKRKLIAPVNDNFSSALILTDGQDPRYGPKRAMYFPNSIKDWLESKLGIENVKLSRSISNLDCEVVVISPEWIRDQRFHLKYFFSTFNFARKLRKFKTPVWVMIGDIYKIEYLITASIIVYLCGGSIPLMSITVPEAKKFGIPFPSGPHIILLNPKTEHLFRSHIVWEKRDKVIIFGSGSERRQRIYAEFHKNLEKIGWETIIARRQYDWDEYRELIKNSQILICSSTLVESAAIRLRFKFLQKNLAEYAITHRIWEGFCGGLLVITDATPVLTEFGFIEDIHFINIQKFIDMKGKLPPSPEMSKIASAGRDLFENLVHNII